MIATASLSLCTGLHLRAAHPVSHKHTSFRGGHHYGALLSAAGPVVALPLPLFLKFVFPPGFYLPRFRPSLVSLAAHTKRLAVGMAAARRFGALYPLVCF